MKDKSRGARCLPRLFENCFELSVLYGDEKVAGGIHIIADCRLPIANCRLVRSECRVVVAMPSKLAIGSRQSAINGLNLFVAAEARVVAARTIKLSRARFNH